MATTGRQGGMKVRKTIKNKNAGKKQSRRKAIPTEQNKGPAKVEGAWALNRVLLPGPRLALSELTETTGL